MDGEASTSRVEEAEPTNSNDNPYTDTTNAQDRKKERLEKLRKLKLRRNEARKLNRAEVVEEDRRNKLPKNWENRKRHAEWELNEMEQKKYWEEKGEDYERIKMLSTNALDAEKAHVASSKKKDLVHKFTTYEDNTIRQYQKLTRNITPDMEHYESQKEELGEELFYPGMNTILQGKVKDKKEGIDRMVKDLEEQIEKRKKYHRRRMHDDDKDVDYINEWNAKFNKKAEHFYGKYTQEIKQNLERGTAV